MKTLFPTVYVGSDAQSQTSLDENITTGDLTLPKPRELLSARNCWRRQKASACTAALKTVLLGVKKSKTRAYTLLPFLHAFPKHCLSSMGMRRIQI